MQPIRFTSFTSGFNRFTWEVNDLLQTAFSVVCLFPLCAVGDDGHLSDEDMSAICSFGWIVAILLLFSSTHYGVVLDPSDFLMGSRQRPRLGASILSLSHTPPHPQLLHSVTCL